MNEPDEAELHDEYEPQLVPISEEAAWADWLHSEWLSVPPAQDPHERLKGG